MKFPFYSGDGSKRNAETPTQLPVSSRVKFMNPEKYVADVGLVDACNVALLLGQPLLLTGEPGTGKTMFASNLAWELGLENALMFATKSTSIAGDLFYIYDALKRFQDVQSSVPADDALPYISYQALGAAILRTKEPAEVAGLVPADFHHPGKSRSVVLIDEIDKAPRDFPNDILNEIEQMYFRVPELGNVKIEADPELQPIVIITSNSEKNLPDPFLRRCVYYNIPFPDRDRLSKIITGRLGTVNSGSEFLNDALEIFFKLREPTNGLRKKPATAELLGWVMALKEILPDAENPLDEPGWAIRTLSNLVKTAEDQARASEIVLQWVNARQK